jgi:arylsulfatase A-like enzyme
MIRNVLALVAALLASLAHAAATRPPNIVIFLADDQGWGDLSITGNTNIKTPNIDSIGRGGVVFDRFFVCSVCAPTRAEFLTGRYHSRGGVRGVSTGLERLNTDERTLADAFKAAGYATGAFGKWHNGSQWPYHPNARGFEEYYGFTSGHWGLYFDPPLEHNGKMVGSKGYITDILTERAMEFIEKNRSKPFLCYVPFNVPHSPFSVPDEFWKRWEKHPITQRGQEGEKEDVQVTRSVMAMTDNLDWNVGRVLKRLDELKLSDNTIVIYFSDNGPNSFRWNGAMKGRKGSTDEGGLRVPFLIRWPGHIPAGKVRPEIAGAIDLLPTLTKLAGISRVGDKPLDGRDLSPLLFGSAREWPDRMIFSHQNGNVSVRTQQYRLDQRGALFDLTNDPSQGTDVRPKNTEVATKLEQAVVGWRREVFGANATAPVADAAPAGKKKGGGGKSAAAAGDARPYPVGYREFPWTPLPARDGVPHGGVKRSGNAPNSSYFTNWKTTDDTMTWDIDVHEAGNYEVALYYTCPAADVGSTVELSFKSAKLSGKVGPAWDPPLLDNQDRVTRVGESYLKDFKPLALGTVKLEKGHGTLTLRATQVPGKQVMDMRMVTLTLR